MELSSCEEQPTLEQLQSWVAKLKAVQTLAGKAVLLNQDTIANIVQRGQRDIVFQATVGKSLTEINKARESSTNSFSEGLVDMLEDRRKKEKALSKNLGRNSQPFRGSGRSRGGYGRVYDSFNKRPSFYSKRGGKGGKGYNNSYNKSYNRNGQSDGYKRDYSEESSSSSSSFSGNGRGRGRGKGR